MTAGLRASQHHPGFLDPGSRMRQRQQRAHARAVAARAHATHAGGRKKNTQNRMGGPGVRSGARERACEGVACHIPGVPGPQLPGSHLTACRRKPVGADGPEAVQDAGTCRAQLDSCLSHRMRAARSKAKTSSAARCLGAPTRGGQYCSECVCAIKECVHARYSNGARHPSRWCAIHRRLVTQDLGRHLEKTACWTPPQARGPPFQERFSQSRSPSSRRGSMLGPGRGGGTHTSFFKDRPFCLEEV